jgi:hypothetical protein
MRKKAVQNLDSRQKTMIDNAFYYTNPPDRPKVHDWSVSKKSSYPSSRLYYKTFFGF